MSGETVGTCDRCGKVREDTEHLGRWGEDGWAWCYQAIDGPASIELCGDCFTAMRDWVRGETFTPADLAEAQHRLANVVECRNLVDERT